MGRIKNKTDNNKKRFLEHLEKSLGVVTTACKKSGISHTQVYKWINEDQEFEDAVNYVRNEVCVDFAESSLYKQIDKNIPSATIFFLKTRGKHRGYVETIETNTKVTREDEIDYSKLSDEELDTLEKLLNKAK